MIGVTLPHPRGRRKTELRCRRREQRAAFARLRFAVVGAGLGLNCAALLSVQGSRPRIFFWIFAEMTTAVTPPHQRGGRDKEAAIFTSSFAAPAVNVNESPAAACAFKTLLKVKLVVMEVLEIGWARIFTLSARCQKKNKKN